MNLRDTTYRQVKGLLIFGAVLVLGLILPGRIWAQGDNYEVRVDLTGGEAAVRVKLDALFGPEQEGNWRRWNGQFVAGGFQLVDDKSELSFWLPDNLSVDNVTARLEVSGIDDNTGGTVFFIGIPEWCNPDPCLPGFDWSCVLHNWFFEMEKTKKICTEPTPGHPYDNTVNVKGGFAPDRVVVPFTNGQCWRYSWDASKNYTIEIAASQSAGTGYLVVREPDGTDVLGLAPDQGRYNLSDISPRDNIRVQLGGNHVSGEAIIGPVIKSVYIKLEAEEGATPAQPDMPECQAGGAGCGCVKGSNPEEAPCSETAGEKPSEPADTPASFSGYSLKWNWTLKGVGENSEWQAKQEMDAPSVDVQAMGAGLPTGELATFTAVPDGYRTRVTNMYFRWCIRDSATSQTKVYNSVLAGGQLAEKANLELPSAGHGDCCEWLTRTPIIDQDDPDHDGVPNPDGMDDNWERLKFVGREINGRRYDGIEDVLPGDDPDGDGESANRFRNQGDGSTLTLVPGLVDSLGNQYYPGGSDGQLTNVEEYILGTDPLQADTDGDGYNDEADFLGEGQSKLEFTPDKAVGLGGYYDIMVSALGVDNRLRVFVATNERRVYASETDRFELALAADQDTLPIGANQQTKVTIKAQPVGGEVEEAELFFRWTLQGEDICDSAKYPVLSQICGFGQSQLTLGGTDVWSFDQLPGMSDLQLGENYVVTATATDSVSRREASDSVTLRKGSALTLATACAEGEAESATVSSDEMTPTTLCVADYGLLSGLDETELNFSWYKDGQLDAAQCGWGKTTYQLVASRSTGATHAVKLVVTTGTALKTAASGGMTLKVVGPTVVITEPAERMEQSDAVAGEASRFMRVTPGETITLTAATQNFGPDTEYEWFWQVGNATAQAAGTAAENGFSYFVPGDVPMGSSIAASVQVRAKDAQQQVTDVTDSLQLVVGETAAQTGMGRSVNGTLAALFSVIPPAWRQSVQIVLVLFAFGGLLLGGAYFYQRVFGR